MVLVSPDGRAFPPPVHLLDFEYEFILEEETTDQLDDPAPASEFYEDPLQRAISELLMNGLRESGYHYDPAWSSSVDRRGVRTTLINISICPTSEEQRETALANRQDLRDNTSRQLMQAWEDLPEEERGRYEIVNQPGSRPRSFTCDIHIVPDVPVPPPDPGMSHLIPEAPPGVQVRPHDQAKFQALGLIQMNVIRSGVCGGMGCTSTLLPDGGDRIRFNDFNGCGVVENEGLNPSMQEVVQTIASQHDWFRVTFPEDSE